MNITANTLRSASAGLALLGATSVNVTSNIAKAADLSVSKAPPIQHYVPLAQDNTPAYFLLGTGLNVGEAAGEATFPNTVKYNFSSTQTDLCACGQFKDQFATGSFWGSKQNYWQSFAYKFAINEVALGLDTTIREYFGSRPVAMAARVAGSAGICFGGNWAFDKKETYDTTTSIVTQPWQPTKTSSSTSHSKTRDLTAALTAGGVCGFNPLLNEFLTNNFTATYNNNTVSVRGYFPIETDGSIKFPSFLKGPNP